MNRMNTKTISSTIFMFSILVMLNQIAYADIPIDYRYDQDTERLHLF
jgi:hypothetical protein